MICRIDLHVHTERSTDSRMTLAQAVSAAKRHGIQAFAVCDHNRCAPQEVFDAPLREGVLLIPGVEYSTEAGHLLGLFLKAPCTCLGEETGRVRFADAAARIHAAGGLCVLAHPYELTHRTVEEITAQIDALQADLDGIECANCRAGKKRANANALALSAAERLKKLQTAGSDAHTPGELGGAYLQVETTALTVEALRAAFSHPMKLSCGRCHHMALAKSQWIRLRKTKHGAKAYFRWVLFAGICFLRMLKGVFQ